MLASTLENFKALKVLSGLLTLELNFNMLTDDGAVALARAIKTNKVLKNLSIALMRFESQRN